MNLPNAKRKAARRRGHAEVLSARAAALVAEAAALEAEVLRRTVPQGMKRCYRCTNTLMACEFNRDVAQRDGLQTACRVCEKAYLRERREKAKALPPLAPEVREFLRRPA